MIVKTRRRAIIFVTTGAAALALGQGSIVKASTLGLGRSTVIAQEEPVGDEPFDDASAERETRQRWGVEEISDVSEAITDAVSEDSDSAGRSTSNTSLSSSSNGGLDYTVASITTMQP